MLQLAIGAAAMLLLLGAPLLVVTGRYRRLQAMLRETEELVRAFFDNNPLRMSMRDHSGRYIRANRAIAAAADTTPEAMAGHYPAEFYPTKVALRIAQHDEAVRRDGIVYDVHRSGPEADVHDYDIVGFPLVGRDGRALGIGTLAVEITDGVRAQRAAMATSIELRAYLDATPDATVVVDGDGIVRFANARVTDLLGYVADDLVGQHVEVLVPDDVRPHHEALRAGYARKPRRRAMGTTIDLHARHHDGNLLPVEISLGPVETPAGMWTVAAIRDVADKRAAEHALRDAEERYRVLAEQDPLTGLYNRRRFEQELESHLAAARGAGSAAGSLISIDVDHFKSVNDSLGHHVGDELVVTIGRTLQEQLRGDDTVARQGGDEFLVLTRNGGEAEAMILAERIVLAVRTATGIFEEAGLRPTASVGVAVLADLPVADLTSQAALIRADVALYAAKAAGRDRAVAWRPEMSAP